MVVLWGLVLLGVGGREEWVAHSGATFHVPDNPSGMGVVGCPPYLVKYFSISLYEWLCLFCRISWLSAT